MPEEWILTFVKMTFFAPLFFRLVHVFRGCLLSEQEGRKVPALQDIPRESSSFEHVCLLRDAAGIAPEISFVCFDYFAGDFRLFRKDLREPAPHRIAL